ncbi:MAG TPA: helix-hairpin-helix domain-containing protein [Gemmatimonadota bacterium]|nr:helix-hairpin-helix domain-containing protein [Gemmatimonadota bacterium]
MRNADVARVMEEIAGLLRFRGDDYFKIRAYENAAAAIRALEEPLDRLLAEGRLRSVPGIGAAIAQKIADYAATGAVPLHQRLIEEIPVGALELLEIPGLGPKRARAAFAEAGIDSLDALEAAARDGRLASVSGFGPRSVETVLKGLSQVRRHSGRHLGADARAPAEILAAWLGARGDVARAQVAGDLRRRMEIVDEIVLVAAAADAPPLIAKFCAHPMVAEIVEREGDGVTVRLGGGLPARLVIVPPASFPTALLVHTGSDSHVGRLRRLATERGFRFEERGLFRADGTVLAAADEADAYSALGLAWIPPELREDRGEVEAAEAGTLPPLVERKDLRGLLHVHTTWSDGRASVGEMARAARDREFAYLLVCDHSRSTSIAGGLTVEDLRRQIDEIRRVDAETEGIEVLAGSEVDILADGSLDFPDDVLSALDCVVASVHAHFRLPRAEQTARLVAALANPWLDILGHPTGRVLLARDGIDVDMEAVLEAAAAHGVALEVNGDPRRLDLDWRWHRAATERGIRLSIAPDAHGVETIEPLIESGVGVARKGGVTAADVLNALDTSGFRAALRRNRG